jgi:hypothetical protein
MKIPRSILYVIFILLFLSDNPFGRGWFQTGDFLPRAALLVVLLIWLITNSNLFHKSLFFLLLYFIIDSIKYFFSGNFNIVGEIVSFAGFAIPMLLFYSISKYNKTSEDSSLYKYIVVLSFLVILSTIRLQIVAPSSLKHMVVLSSLGDMGAIYSLQKQGMAGYDFAAMVMMLPPVYITLFRESHERKRKRQFALAFLLSFAFMFLGQVTTTLLICVLMTFLSLFVKDNNKSFILYAGLIFLFISIIFQPLLEAVAPQLAGFEDYGAKVNDIIESNQTGELTGQVGGRVELYRISLNSFFKRPFWGDVNAEIGGHAFFIDKLAISGIIGCLPLFLSIYYMAKDCARILRVKYQMVYYICMMGLVVLGFLKNMVGMDYWLFSFFYIPFILYYNQQHQKRIIVINKYYK